MTNTTAGNKGNGELNQFPTIQTTMARLQDCKKGMYLQFGWRNDGKKFKILKVNKHSVTINLKINFGTGMLITPERPHNMVVRESRLADCTLSEH